MIFKKFQKLELEVKKKERAAELKAKPFASSLKEQAKDAGSKLRETFMKFLGPNSFVGKLFGGKDRSTVSQTKKSKKKNNNRNRHTNCEYFVYLQEYT